MGGKSICWRFWVVVGGGVVGCGSNDMDWDVFQGAQLPRLVVQVVFLAEVM